MSERCVVEKPFWHRLATPATGALGPAALLSTGTLTSFLLSWVASLLVLFALRTAVGGGDRAMRALALLPAVSLGARLLGWDALLATLAALAIAIAAVVGPAVVRVGGRLIGVLRSGGFPAAIAFALECFAALALVLGWVACLAPAVRRGLPYVHYWDEPQTVAVALRMLKTGDFNPHFFKYPSFSIYLHAAWAHVTCAALMLRGTLASPNDVRTLFDTGYFWTNSHPAFWLSARVFQAALGLVGVAVVSAAMRRRFGPGPAAATAFAYALGAYFVDRNGWVTVDATTAAVASAWAASILVGFGDPERGRRWFMVTAGLAGVAVATKYNAVPIMLPTLALPFFERGETRLGVKEALVRARDGAVLALAAFAVCTPYALADFFALAKGMGFELRHYTQLGHGVHTLRGFVPHLTHDLAFLRTSSEAGLLGLVALGGALVVSAVRGRGTCPLALILLFPVTYVLFMATTIIAFDRNLTLVLPFMGIAVGYLLATVQQLFRRPFLRTLVAVVGVLAVSALPISAIVDGTRLRALVDVDSRTRVLSWVQRIVDEAPQGRVPRVWVVQEALIHPDEVQRLGKTATVVPAAQAATAIANGERGADLIVTAQLVDWGPEVVAANQALFANCPSLLREGADGPLLQQVVAIDPTILVLDARRCAVRSPP